MNDVNAPTLRLNRETHRCRVWRVGGIGRLLGDRRGVPIGLLVRRRVSLGSPTSRAVRRASDSGRWTSHCRSLSRVRGRN